MFVESAGRPDVIAGATRPTPSGLTQILAQTGSSLLGMHIDLARSRQADRPDRRRLGAGPGGLVARLQRPAGRVDDRFDPRQALAGDGPLPADRRAALRARRTSRSSPTTWGSATCSACSTTTTAATPCRTPQLYFDTAPDHHPPAYALISGFGDDSSLYYWRLLGAQQIMRLYRTDRSALKRQIALQTAADSNADVLHPPGPPRAVRHPGRARRRLRARRSCRCPRTRARLGLRYDPAIGSLAARLGFAPALYRGLRRPRSTC